jgi:hypothetical protein
LNAQRINSIVLLLLAVGGARLACAQDSSQPQGKIEIRQIEWGFDGKSTPRTFIPLSLLVENPGPTPATGTIRLTKYYGIDRQVDAEFEQSYYVSGFSTKWVQLTPFVVEDFERWRLSWGPNFHNRADVPTPRIGERATVLFAETEDATAVGSALRRCDPALFPVSVTGTDSLRGAVLHAVPNWQGARAQAFREWLERGGRVYLVHGADGEYVKFPGELAFLNIPEDRFRVGAGIVKRLPLSVRDIDAETARRQILTDQEVEQPEEVAARRLAAAQFGSLPTWTEFDGYLFRELQYSTRFKRNWWLIYATAVLFLLAVFPGSYLLGRRVTDWRWFYAGFIGTSLVFSAGFARMGQLGSAERSRTRTVATAFQLAEGIYDVTQWTCAASRDGDLYEFTNDGSGRLFTSCQELEPVNGVVRLQDGRFDVDMPPASTCNILQRSRIEGPPLGVKVETLRASTDTLQQFSVKFAPGVFDRTMLVCAMYRDSVYRMSTDANGARLVEQRQDTVNFTNHVGILPWQETPRTTNIWGNDIDAEVTSTESFQVLMRQAVGTTLNLPPSATSIDVKLDPSIVRLLIYRPLPEELRFAGDKFPDQQGYILYVVDLPSPARSP